MKDDMSELTHIGAALCNWREVQFETSCGVSCLIIKNKTLCSIIILHHHFDLSDKRPRVRTAQRGR